jgi:hypothetical protein
VKRTIATGVVLFAAVAGCASSGKPSGTSTATTSAQPTADASPKGHYTAPPSVLPVPGVPVTMSTSVAPWPPPAVIDQGAHSADYVAAAGLPYGEETTKVHYHAHLDVIVDGKPVPVPAYLGFVARGRTALGLSALHTHDATGVIHIENNMPATFVLGQVFVEWGVRFSAECVGGYCTGGGKQLAVFVNGRQQAGDVTRIVLAKHQEIAVVYGTPDQLTKPPSSYHFTSGE